ncbi:hypothetical protein K3495_g15294, partial [Podosphaera aphanis]
EKPDNHTAFRLSGVPRSYAGYDGSNIVMETIDAAVVAEALADLTKVAPINVLESRGSSYSEYSPTKSWIVLYPKGSNLSRSLPLFGVRVSAKLLPQRTRVPQCGRCFGWHNERSCSRFPRCRICSSTHHVEKGHISCNPVVAHECPPKCANCHGPHPADSLECLLRPRKDNTFPSKQETAAIRQAAAAARLRLKATHCGILQIQSTTPTVSQTPSPQIPNNVNRTPTLQPVTGLGSYAILAENGHQSNSVDMNE